MYATYKLVTYAYVASSLNLATVEKRNYCEIGNLQSPHVKKIDSESVDKSRYNPITTCVLPNNNAAANKEILLECLITPPKWLKI